MIGLATKAGKIASGEFAVESAVRKGKACLVIIASDASDNTKKSFNDMGAYYHVPVYIYGTKESLGTHTGRGYSICKIVGKQEVHCSFAGVLLLLVIRGLWG